MKKFEKYAYPIMLGLCLITGIVNMIMGKEYFWPMITSIWVAIAWTNYLKK